MKSVYVILVVFLVAAISGNVINDNGSRILGGTTASISQYPFVVSMLNELFNTYFLTANGIILTNNAILSAAHPYVNSDDTVQPTSRWKARVGSVYFNIGGTLHEIAQITIHPNFNSDGSNSIDLAVVRTSSPIVFNDYAKQATLAHMDFGLPNNQEVVAVGWGLQRLGEIQMFPQLLNNGLRLRDQTACSSLLDETVTKDVICAVATINGAGPCTGNAGSALILNNLVLGIFSHNRECGNTDEPNIYVNVATHIHWISDAATEAVPPPSL